MTDKQRAGIAPMSLDNRLAWAREIAAKHEADHAATGSFASQLAASSMRQHIAELEAKIAERDARIRAEMEGKPTPIYDKLKAEGLEPPVSVMLIDARKPTDEEIAYGLSLLEGK